MIEDVFPDETVEGLWGVRMGTELGTLVFSCWQKLLCMGSTLVAQQYPQPYVCPVALAAAIEAGKLPELFENATRGCLALNQRCGPYLQAMVDHGFDDIPWDLQLHRGIVTVASAPISSYSHTWTFSDEPPLQEEGFDFGEGVMAFRM